MDSIHDIDNKIDDNLLKRGIVNRLMLCLKFENEGRECLVDSVPDHIRPTLVVLVELAQSVDNLLGIALIAAVDLLGSVGSLCLIVFGLLIHESIHDSG